MGREFMVRFGLRALNFCGFPPKRMVGCRNCLEIPSLCSFQRLNMISGLSGRFAYSFGCFNDSILSIQCVTLQLSYCTALGVQSVSKQVRFFRRRFKGTFNTQSTAGAKRRWFVEYCNVI